MKKGIFRVADDSAQAVEADVVEVVAAPAFRLARPEVTSLALHAKRPSSRRSIAGHISTRARPAFDRSYNSAQWTGAEKVHAHACARS